MTATVCTSEPFLSRMDTLPSLKPIAMLCPSGDQAKQAALLFIFILPTFLAGNRKHSSPADTLAHTFVIGLKDTPTTASEWFYLHEAV